MKNTWYFAAILFTLLDTTSGFETKLTNNVNSTFQLSADKSVSPEVFTWNVTGGITDGGTWADISVLWAAVKSPVVGTLHDSFVLTSRNGKGTLKIRFDGRLKATNDPNVFNIVGNWRILSGTGFYKKKLGSGQGNVMINFSTSKAEGTLTGQIH